MSSWIFSFQAAYVCLFRDKPFPAIKTLPFGITIDTLHKKRRYPSTPQLTTAIGFVGKIETGKPLNQPIIPVGSFWLVGATYLPLRKMMEWVRQLGPDDIPNWMESLKIPWFQSPPTRSFINYIPMFVLSHFQMLVNSHEITNQLMVISIIIPFDIPIIPIYSQKLFPLYHKSILFFPSTYNDYS